MDVQVRVHKSFDLGGGYALAQGIHTLPVKDLLNYETAILDGRMFFALEINQIEALNEQLNQQIFNLYKAFLESHNSVSIIVGRSKWDLSGAIRVVEDFRGLDTHGFSTSFDIIVIESLFLNGIRESLDFYSLADQSTGQISLTENLDLSDNVTVIYYSNGNTIN